MNDKKKARKYMQRAQVIIETLKGADHPAAIEWREWLEQEDRISQELVCLHALLCRRLVALTQSCRVKLFAGFKWKEFASKGCCRYASGR